MFSSLLRGPVSGHVYFCRCGARAGTALRHHRYRIALLVAGAGDHCELPQYAARHGSGTGQRQRNRPALGRDQSGAEKASRQRVPDQVQGGANGFDAAPCQRAYAARPGCFSVAVPQSGIGQRQGKTVWFMRASPRLKR